MLALQEANRAEVTVVRVPLGHALGHILVKLCRDDPFLFN